MKRPIIKNGLLADPYLQRIAGHLNAKERREMAKQMNNWSEMLLLTAEELEKFNIAPCLSEKDSGVFRE